VTHAALQLWKQYKKRANVLVVFDVSGSMSTQERLPNAKKGAHQLLEMLGDDDRFALMPFNDKVPPPPPPQPLRTARAAFAQQIDALYAHGGTALYDAILAGYQAQAKQPQDEVITAVVVLTDGDDTNSRLRLESLVDQIKLDPEKRPIRVFTIGYGAEANKDVMRRIADATQAASYEGKPENIRAVFKDISTFF
jgi:Ca-activated chloride channel family protein